MATVVTEVEMAAGLMDLTGYEGYHEALVLLRLHERVVGKVRVPVRLGVITAADLRAAVDANAEISRRAIGVALDDWLLPSNGAHTPAPTWTVVICTRNRTEQLRRCLDSMVSAGVTDGEVIVVDNGPSDDATEVLAARYPVTYVRTDRAGLNHARSVGAQLASGDVVIYTDDDVVVDRRWIPAVLSGFAGARVGAVTGPGIPFALATEAQELFERYCSFDRGFERREFDYTNIPPSAAGRVGSGLNMAMRRDLILTLGLFDAELDLGTRAITGGDTYALYLLLAEGYRVVYVPEAIVRHVHRSDAAAVRDTVYGYGVGVLAFLTRCILKHRDMNAARTALSWIVNHHMRQIARTLLRRPGHFPLRLILAELRGAAAGPFMYLLTRRAERKRRSATIEIPLIIPEPVDELARV